MIGRDLMAYYKMNLILHDEHHWDLEYFDNQYPYERDLYMGLLVKQMRENKERADASRSDLKSAF